MAGRRRASWCVDDVTSVGMVTTRCWTALAAVPVRRFLVTVLTVWARPNVTDVRIS